MLLLLRLLLLVLVDAALSDRGSSSCLWLDIRQTSCYGTCIAFFSTC